MAEIRYKTFVVGDEPESEIIAKPSGRKRKYTESRSTSSSRNATTTDRRQQTKAPGCSFSVGTIEAPVDVNKIQVYKSQLFQHKLVIPVDVEYCAFMLQDFNLETLTLKKNCHIVSRRTLPTDSGPFWVYICSCDSARSRLICGLPASSKLHSKEFECPYEECHHIEVIKDIVTDFDSETGISAEDAHEKRKSKDSNKSDHSYDKWSPEVTLFAFDGDNDVVCVRLEENNEVTYSIVTLEFGNKKTVLRCTSCQNTQQCKHTEAILNDSSDLNPVILDRMKESPKFRSRYIPTSISKSKIPFSVSSEKRPNFGTDGQSEICLVPDTEGVCECGSSWGDELEECDSIKIFSRTYIYSARTFRRKCTTCLNFKDYDGLEDGLLNMGSYMVCHQVLRLYQKQFVTESTTMASFYKEWYWSQLESGNASFNEECSYNRFRHAWYCFLELLHIDFREGFLCPSCGDCPDKVVMDGVTLGVRKVAMPWNIYLEKFGQSYALDGCSYNMRNFLNNREARQLLKKYTAKGITEREFNLLVNKVNTYQPALKPILQYFYEDGYIHKCPPAFLKLFDVLSLGYPVCGLLHFHPGLFEILENLCNDEFCISAEEAVSIEQEAPILFQLFSSLDWKIPVYLKVIMKELITKSLYPFEDRVQHDLPVCGESCICTGIGCFPSLSKLCHRGSYILDDKKKGEDKNAQCTKRASSHKTLIPGLFTLSCIHGICYGFQLMEDAESPNTPYSILRTRFHTAPKLVIYDNACNLHAYALNRDPAFFKDTWFVVDRFHWPNHVGCHEGYNLSNYMQHQGVNSQVAEQRNSSLKKLKSMLSYMSVKNFISHLRFFMWFRNMICLSISSPDLPLKYMSVFQHLKKVYSTLGM